MKILGPTIASFIRQDTRINAADSFANVASMQRLRINHNALYSRRIRRNLFSIQLQNSTSSKPRFSLTGSPHSHLSPIINVPVWITQGVKVVNVNIYGSLNTLSSGDITVYGHCFAENESVDQIEFGRSCTFTATSNSTKTIAITVTRRLRDKGGEGRVRLWGKGIMYGADKLGGAAAITGVGPDYLEGNVGSTNYNGDFVYIVTDGSIQPRRIARTILNIDAAGNDRLYVAPAWNTIPDTNADTFEIRDSANLDVWSINAYEEIIAATTETVYEFPTGMRV